MLKQPISMEANCLKIDNRLVLLDPSIYDHDFQNYIVYRIAERCEESMDHSSNEFVLKGIDSSEHRVEYIDMLLSVLHSYAKKELKIAVIEALIQQH